MLKGTLSALATDTKGYLVLDGRMKKRCYLATRDENVLGLLVGQKEQLEDVTFGFWKL